MLARPRLIWACYAAAAAALALALAVISAQLLSLQHRERTARAHAALQESIRLALWRIDAVFAPTLAAEAARPYFHYRAFYAPTRAYSAMYQPLRPDDVLVPSPLLTDPLPPFILLHFQIDPPSVLSSPQAPDSAQRDLALTFNLPPQRLDLADRRRQHLQRLLLGSPVPPPPLQPPQDALAPPDDAPQLSAEYSIRRELAHAPAADADSSPAPVVRAGPFRAVWRIDPDDGSPQLLMLRDVSFDADSIIQGFWVDWPALSRAMLDRVADLLPDASLLPIYQSTDQAALAHAGRMLAHIPAVLVPPPLSLPPVPLLTPTNAALALAWAATILAAAVVALALRHAIDLADRRGRFVAAVTHELRTPLTTFCLYTDMLASGTVPPDDHPAYLRTLHQQAQRLASTVQSVLEYARLSSPRRPSPPNPAPIAPALESILPALHHRAQQAGMNLHPTIDLPPDLAAPIDPHALDRILTTLVDNACTHAAGAADKRILLHAAVSDNRLLISVTDHGPGIPRALRARLFRPFHRAPATADRSPGLGLGLPIAAALARRSRARLSADNAPNAGARFILSIPLR